MDNGPEDVHAPAGGGGQGISGAEARKAACLGDQFGGGHGPHAGQAADDGGVRVAREQRLQFVVELTHNWPRNWPRKEPYALGEGFGHLAIAVTDIYGACERLAAEGVKIPRPPGPMKHGGSVIAFIEDPDGYKIELVERG